MNATSILFRMSRVPAGARRKSSTLMIMLLWLMIQGNLALGQIGVNTDTPDNSTALDIVATNKGLLIPRVALTSDLTDPSPVTNPAVGLLVFNSGVNQPVGFYYWDGVHWVALGSGGSAGGDYWSLWGNSGTDVSSNFLGTIDAMDLAIYSNNTERMRFGQGGQTMIGVATPFSANDLLTVNGSTTRINAIGVYSNGTGSNGVGVFVQATGYGFSASGGTRGLNSLVNTSAVGGCALYGRNQYATGYGMLIAGSGQSTQIIGSRSAGISTVGSEGIMALGTSATGWGAIATGSGYTWNTLSGRSGGVAATGADGLYGWGRAATGRGIIAGGNGTGVFNMSLECEGGAFTGTHGVFANGTSASGTGVIGLGSGLTTYSLIASGVGGWFAGNMGLYGKGTAAEGIGVVGVGNNGNSYFTVTGGSGGSFTGNHGLISVGTNTSNGTGIVAAGNGGGYSVYTSGSGGSFTGTYAGVVGYGTDASTGTGVIGTGNSIAPATLSAGSGGAFTGNAGVYGKGGTSSGTGVIGLGNNLANPNTYTGGSGGAFTGTSAGAVAWGTTAGSGIGVIGAGNNTTPVLPGSSGCGGAFTGTTYGVYGFATNSSSTRGGGYFACNPTSGGAYVYCGYRSGNTNYKFLGNGSTSTIVKNTKGDLITLFCPEAPEVVFQDYGIGQLVDGRAHITIDPDLALNINVSEQHPLKVYITPEGDCNGVYVTNKSANGFDVIELMGGTSNVSFAWQIVATRADESVTLKDGSVEETYYHMRFPPAPGPLEVYELNTVPAKTNYDGTDVNGNGMASSGMQKNSISPEEKKVQTIHAEDAENIEIIDDK